MRKQYRSPDREHGRYSNWIYHEYDTNYWKFRHLWFPKNEYHLWNITHGTLAYVKQDRRSTTKRPEKWEGERNLSRFTTYFYEIREAYSKKKSKENKRVYNRK